MKEKIKVLYEDNHLLVVIKPINILSQSDKTKDIDMLTLVKLYIKEKYQKPGNVYAGLVHRLDRPTGGVMIFAKTSKCASRLSEQIKNNEMNKRYYAVVNGILKNKKDKLENYIKKEDSFSKIVSKEEGKYAALEYKVIKEQDNMSLLDINLLTGRHHQIRVQFAHINHPLYGDQRYGKEDKNQLALYAYHLEFNHPITKERMIFEDKPKYGIFKKFN